MNDHGPPRLRDDPTVPESIRNDLARAAQTPSRRYDVTAGLAAFERSIGKPSTAESDSGARSPSEGSATTGSSAATKLGVRWWGLGATGTAAVVAGVITMASGAGDSRGEPEDSQATQPPTRSSASARNAPVQSDAGAASRPGSGRAAAPGAPGTPVARDHGDGGPSFRSESSHEGSAETEAAPETEALLETEASAAETATSSDTDIPAPRSAHHPNEIAQLAEARRRLKRGDAAGALELARAGQRRFSDGIFVEERAALVVFALHRLGRAGAAHRAGRRFLRRYPESPFAPEIRKIVP